MQHKAKPRGVVGGGGWLNRSGEGGEVEEID